jgi:hypothetical protein
MALEEVLLALGGPVCVGSKILAIPVTGLLLAQLQQWRKGLVDRRIRAKGEDCPPPGFFELLGIDAFLGRIVRLGVAQSAALQLL